MTREIASTETPEEAAILVAFRQGHLDLFYRKVYPGILLFASRYLGERMDFLAEDCVQDAIFDAWKKREHFHSLPSLRSFLYTSIRNDIISLSRKEQAHRRYLSRQEEAILFNTSVIDQETRLLLHNAIASLPPKERQILEMSFIEGLKNAEIAEKLALSDSSIKKYKTSAIRALRQKLARLLPSFFGIL
ncbi:MAG: sigma-70 family RNA polymerase sigma factor [Odoribacteraceae bacterium]|jgi:RNA polymerase sigma-70 factor (ECF subfamily)|nr:sigma-70 family RNA polymerase sigma factor [Odoribacteraceae bacterium]